MIPMLTPHTFRSFAMRALELVWHLMLEIWDLLVPPLFTAKALSLVPYANPSDPSRPLGEIICFFHHWSLCPTLKATPMSSVK